MRELEDLVEDKARLSRLLLSHLVNRSLYSAGLRSHQKIEMANGRHVNVFARKSKDLIFIILSFLGYQIKKIDFHDILYE